MENPSLIKLKMLVIGSILTLNGILAQQNSADTLELWTTYLRKKSQPINLTPGTDDDDLKGLKKVLSNKRIVLLGEFNHGSKEINLLKNRLIAYLVQALGYKVLLLESGVAEVNTLNHQRQEMSKENMIFRLTGPKDIKALIASLKSEAAFFDFPHKSSKNTTWLEEHLLVNDTFIDLDNYNKMQLGKCFDGLFLIKNITPAVY